MPKKAVSKQNSRIFKKDTASTSKKALTSSDKKNTSSIKNKRTHNDQNKISKSHEFEDFDHDDSVNFNKVLTSSNTEDSRMQYSNSRSLGSQSRSRSRYSLSRHSCSHSQYSSLQSSHPHYEVAAYVAKRPELLKIVNQMAYYDGLKMSDNEEKTMESMKFQTFLKCMFFRTRHLTKEIILKCIKLCFSSKKLSYKDISVLKSAANAAYRFYREALQSGLRKIAVHFIDDFKITCSSRIEQSDIQDYLQEEVWRSFLNWFYEAIDKEATFMTEFKKTWQTFMSDCFLKMVEETLDEEKKL
ncbi:3661_t:CDS:2, partial [Cetraspora pellucida]